jgi:hypothetical protein
MSKKEKAVHTVRVRFDGRVFVPEEPVNLPTGHVLEIPIAESHSSEGASHPLVDLVELLKQFPSNPDWPPDGAAQHDHYLYGTPKTP